MAGRDKIQPYLLRSLAETRGRLVAAQAERIVRVEQVDERVHEEELDEEARVRVRRTIDRRIVRGELRERYAALLADAGADPVAIVPRVREQLEADLARIAESAAANPGDAIRRFGELVPADDWPAVLVMADRPGGTDALVRHLSSLNLRCAQDESLRRFGIVSVNCPPDVGLAAVVAASPLVETMADPSAPVMLPVPQAVETQMLEARDLLNVTREMMDGFGHDVTLAVLDTGIDQAHPAFARLQPGDYHNFTRFEDTDDRGHGTHVASIAAGDDRAGAYSGVAPRVHVVAGKVIPGRMPGRLEDVLRGMAWAVFEKRADVLSLSIADSDTTANGRSIWSRACDEAYRNGTLVCVAAGNLDPAYPETVMVPADAACAIAVGAIDKDGRLAPFSAQGSSSPGAALYGKPNCVVPGVGIVAARSSYSEIEPYGGNGLYAQLSGTSMAAPAAAGCLALLKSKARSVGWNITPAELLDVFYSACRPLATAEGEEYSRDFEIGRGLPDMQAAFARVEALAPSRASRATPARAETPARAGPAAPVQPRQARAESPRGGQVAAEGAEARVREPECDMFGTQFLSAFERNVRAAVAIEAPHTRDRFSVAKLEVQTPKREFGEVRRYAFTKKLIKERLVFSLAAVALKASALEGRDGPGRLRGDLLDQIASTFELDEQARHVIGVYSPVGWPPDWRGQVHDSGHIQYYLIEKVRQPEGSSLWDVWGADSPSSFRALFNPETWDQEVARVERALEAHPELRRLDGIVSMRELMKNARVGEKAVRAVLERAQSGFITQERRGETFILRASLR